MLLRRTEEPSRDHEARVLRGLWPLLSDRTLADFKSPSREFRSGELLRLLRYGLEYHEINIDELASREALTLVLIVPRSNKALRDELALLDCTLTPLSTAPRKYLTTLASHIATRPRREEWNVVSLRD